MLRTVFFFFPFFFLVSFHTSTCSHRLFVSLSVKSRCRVSHFLPRHRMNFVLFFFSLLFVLLPAHFIDERYARRLFTSRPVAIKAATVPGVAISHQVAIKRLSIIVRFVHFYSRPVFSPLDVRAIANISKRHSVHSVCEFLSLLCAIYS